MKLSFGALFTCALLLAGVFVTGCGSLPDIPLTGDNPAPTASTGSPAANPSATFRVGDTVSVTFSGPPTPLDPHIETIKENGTITLDYIGSINALGKTPGELQNEIHNDYVPKYFTHLTVNVRSGDRFFLVAGEVHNPGRVIFLDGETLTKAIQAAGGLTDFASHSKVWLTHAGKRVQVDYDKALKDPSADPMVYPDDQIFVDKSW